MCPRGQCPLPQLRVPLRVHVGFMYTQDHGSHPLSKQIVLGNRFSVGKTALRVCLEPLSAWLCLKDSFSFAELLHCIEKTLLQGEMLISDIPPAVNKTPVLY